MGTNALYHTPHESKILFFAKTIIKEAMTKKP